MVGSVTAAVFHRGPFGVVGLAGEGQFHHLLERDFLLSPLVGPGVDDDRHRPVVTGFALCFGGHNRPPFSRVYRVDSRDVKLALPRRVLYIRT